MRVFLFIPASPLPLSHSVGFLCHPGAADPSTPPFADGQDGGHAFSFFQSSVEGCFAHASCWQAEQKNRGAGRERQEEGMSARQQEKFLKSKCLQRHNRGQAGRGEGHSSPLPRQAGLCANPSESNRSRRNLSRLPDFSIWLGSQVVDVEKFSVL